jgi:uncharacterized protein (UPF0335 family)
MAKKKNHDDDDDLIGKVGDNSGDVATEELRQLVERWESLESDKKAASAEQKDVMAEAKARGYDTKALRKLLAERKRDPDEVEEERAVLDLYRAALGMA